MKYYIVHGKGEAYDYGIVKGHWTVIYSVFETVIDGPFDTEQEAQVKLDELYDEMAMNDIADIYANLDWEPRYP